MVFGRRVVPVLCILALSGCSSPARITVGNSTRYSGEILEETPPNRTGEEELRFCVEKMEYKPGGYYSSQPMDGRDRAFYLGQFTRYNAYRHLRLAESGSEPCDVILRMALNSTGKVNGQTNTVSAWSAADGSRLMEAEGDGPGGIDPVPGLARVGRFVYNAFVPGTPLYRKVAGDPRAEEEAFREAVRKYREAAEKPPFPEQARKFQVQAEAAFNRKDFPRAVKLYKDALSVAPWWPEGRYNRALILGDLGRYAEAMTEMRRYLALVPDAPDARAAQDKIYEWESLAGEAAEPAVGDPQKRGGGMPTKPAFPGR